MFLCCGQAPVVISVLFCGSAGVLEASVLSIFHSVIPVLIETDRWRRRRRRKGGQETREEGRKPEWVIRPNLNTLVLFSDRFFN